MGSLLLFDPITWLVQWMLLGYDKQGFASSILNTIWLVFDSCPHPRLAPLYGV